MAVVPPTCRRGRGALIASHSQRDEQRVNEYDGLPEHNYRGPCCEEAHIRTNRTWTWPRNRSWNVWEMAEGYDPALCTVAALQRCFSSAGGGAIFLPRGDFDLDR